MASGETGIARAAFCRLLGATPLFPKPHLFGAEEEQKLTAASVEATKKRVIGCLWLEDRRFLAHTLVCI